MDEHIHPLYMDQIRQLNPEIVVRAVGKIDAPPKGTLDPEILKWCEQRQFLLVTNNRKSMPPHLQDPLAEGRHIPDIIMLSQTMSIGDMIEELVFGGDRLRRQRI
ncbi:MAG: hypothetical protein AAFQ95_18120 [Cyanobacteria bacterium J06621_3]